MYICIAQQDLYAKKKISPNLANIETISRLYKPGNGSTNPFSYALKNWQKLSPTIKSALAQQVVNRATQPQPPDFGSLSITGSVTISGNNMIIALPTNINDMTIVAPVIIKVPTGGSLVITVNGTSYTNPIPGLTIQTTGTANNFTVSGNLSVSSGSITVDTGKIATVNGMLSYNGSDISGTSFTNNGTIIAAGDISITHAHSSTKNAVTANNISSTTGNIVISNNAATGNFNGVYSNGTISTIASKALTFANNSSTGIQGVLTDSAGTIESGTINFTNNIGSDNSYGFELSSNVFTNELNITVDCSSTNQDYMINTTVYEYTSHTTPLPDSQINIDNTNCGGGSLTMTGSVTISGNILTLALPTNINDMTIVAPVVVKVPTGGSLIITVNGAPYVTPIPGLTIQTTEAANNFIIRGDFSVTASTSEVYVNIPAGATLKSSRTLTCNGGLDQNNRLGSVFNAGTINASGNITMSYNQGPDTLAGIENRGTITTSSGDIEMNYNQGGGIGAGGIGSGAGIGGSGDTAVYGGTIESLSGNIVMNYNTGGTGYGSGGAGIGGGGGSSSAGAIGGAGGASAIIVAAAGGNIFDNTGGFGADAGGGGAGFGGGGGAAGGGPNVGGAGGNGTTYSTAITIGTNTGGAGNGGQPGAGTGAGGSGSGGNAGAGGAAYTAV